MLKLNFPRSLLGVLIFWITTACNSPAGTLYQGAGYQCDHVDLITGQTLEAPFYSVEVGTDFETRVFMARLTISFATNTANDESISLLSSDGSPSATSFSGSNDSFTLSADRQSGILSLDNGSHEFQCTPAVASGAVTGSN